MVYRIRLHGSWQVLDTRVVEVSMTAADAFHRDLHLAEGTILLHLGVNSSGSNFTLVRLRIACVTWKVRGAVLC